MEELQKGHGLHCANGHRWSGNLVFDANESKGKDKIPLTPKERDEVTDRFGPGPHECSFARDEDGYYCYTHRARSKSYPSISKIPKDKYEFIGSTG